MDRTSYYEIGGKMYPMRFGISATKKINERFGGIDKMADVLTGETDLSKLLDTVIFVLETLINQGCSYKNIFEKDIPAPAKAPVIDGKWVPLTTEELEVGIDITEVESLTKAIMKAYTGGAKKEISADSKEKKEEAM